MILTIPDSKELHDTGRRRQVLLERGELRVLRDHLVKEHWNLCEVDVGALQILGRGSEVLENVQCLKQLLLFALGRDEILHLLDLGDVRLQLDVAHDHVERPGLPS